jgi:predicted permease
VGLGYDFQAKDMEVSFRHAVESFSTLQSGALYSSTGANVVLGRQRARRLQATETSARFFRVLGVRPFLGRGFAADEDVQGRDHEVLISDRLWRGAFHSNPAVVGRTIRVDGFAFEVIGVLPPHVNFPKDTDLWVPTIFDPHASLVEAGAFFTPMIARVRQGVSNGAVRAEFKARWMQARKTDATAQRPLLVPIASELTKGIQSSLVLLGGAVGFVLLIACANVSCLVLVRASERRAELAVRAALGAAQGVLIRQRLVETTLLAILGGGLGLWLAEGILHLLFMFRPTVLADYARPHLDMAMFGFTAGLALATGLAVGLLPAVMAGRGDPVEALKRGMWRSTGAGNEFRRVLVAGEIALTFVLLTGTGLLVHTMVNLNRVPLGYDVRKILTFSTSLDGPQAVGKHARHRDADFYTAVLDRLASIPGVEAVGAASDAPLSTRAQMLLPVSTERKKGRPVSALLRVVSGGYFNAMGVSLVKGRSFSKEDSVGGRRVVIISEDLAKRLWPGRSLIGRQLHC